MSKTNDEFDEHSFVFSAKVAKESEEELREKKEALGQRVERLIHRATVNNIPLLHHILQLTDDPADLQMLGKALIRLSELLPELHTLEKRHTLVEESLNNPQWLAATFADLSGQVDRHFP